ncbi:tetratricopeptide repeat protein [soil metagenome]
MSETELPSIPSTEPPSALSTMDRRIILGLVILVLACFWPLGQADFLSYDDPTFVTFNPYIRQGITLDTIKYAFTSFESGYWHPLTWLSHALDVNIYGPMIGTPRNFPAGHHFTNLLLHMGSTLLLWQVLKRMTGANLASAWVAAMFAVHPMHVESVAWISERKSTLSTLFFLLTILAYHHYLQRRTLERYVLIVLAFACALMSKPMTVTTPVVLLLLDVWPLNRIALGRGFWRSLVQPIVEKIPLFVLSAGSAYITIHSTIVVKTFYYFSDVPLKQRLETSIISYARYLGKLVWPTHLSVFYPFPPEWPVAWVAGSCVLFVVLTAIVLLLSKKRPYLFVGWMWFAIMLVPVIGLFAVGDSSLADRYTYVPYIGLFIAIAWLAMSLPKSLKPTLIGLGALSIVLCAGVTFRQVWFWRNTTTLMGHSIDVTKDNWLAELNYGLALEDTPRQSEAEAHVREAVRIRPGGAAPNLALAKILLDAKKVDEAIPHIYIAGKVKPDAWNFKTLYARALAMTGRHVEAVQMFQDILKDHPQIVEAEIYLARSMVALGQLEEAEMHLRNALKYDPGIAQVHFELAQIAAELDRPQDAIDEYEAAIALNPGFGVAHLNYGIMLAKIGKYPEAMQELTAADNFLAADDLHERSLLEMNTALLLEKKLMRPLDASEHYIKALDFAKKLVELQPKEPAAQFELARTLNQVGQPEQAAVSAQKAMDLAVANGNRYFIIEIQRQFPNVKFKLPTTQTTPPASQPTTQAN